MDRKLRNFMLDIRDRLDERIQEPDPHPAVVEDLGYALLAIVAADARSGTDRRWCIDQVATMKALRIAAATDRRRDAR